MYRRGIGSFLQEPDAPLDERRAAMERVDKLPRPRRVEYTDTEIGDIPAIVATPTKVPVERHVLYLHGGGYVVGSAKTHIAMCARLAKRARAEATAIDYRLAPENPYPAAIDDCVAAYTALIERVDPRSVTIAGDSAGGGAALATLCALRDAGAPLPAAAYLISPWTDLTGSGDSVRTLADVDPMIDASWLTDVGREYAGVLPLDHHGVSPLFADLSGLPPMLVQVGSDEVLLSDSTRLVERVRAAGGSIDLDVHPGMWHVFQMMPGMPEATTSLTEAAAYIRTKTPAPALLAAIS